jgi:hypothetical protein
MAAMTTVLKEFNDLNNKRVFTTPTHTTSKPAFMTQSRKALTPASTVSEDEMAVSLACEDADGAVLPTNALFSVRVRKHLSAISGDIAAAKALFREFVASDEFDVMVDQSNYINE